MWKMRLSPTGQGSFLVGKVNTGTHVKDPEEVYLRTFMRESNGDS